MPRSGMENSPCYRPRGAAHKHREVHNSPMASHLRQFRLPISCVTLARNSEIQSGQTVSPRKNDSLIGWTTITYRSVMAAVFALLALILIVLYFMYPEQTKNALSSVASKLASKLGGGGNSGQSLRTGSQQANFTAIDGTVRVRKSSSNN